MRLIAFCLWLLAGLAFGGAAQAATISIQPPEEGKPTFVLVQGTFTHEDGEEFVKIVAPLTDAIIAFNSDGGSVLAGVTMGDQIFAKKFGTLVTNGARCASACAIAWLGGVKRFMGSEARIGFHAAYDAKTGRESGAANAVIGAFLNKIGLPYSAIIYITQTAPTSMTWLRLNEAIAQGIQVTLLNMPSARPKPSESKRENTDPSDDPQHHRGPEQAE